jgi:hypothetical protein
MQPSLPNSYRRFCEDMYNEAVRLASNNSEENVGKIELNAGHIAHAVRVLSTEYMKTLNKDDTAAIDPEKAKGIPRDVQLLIRDAADSTVPLSPGALLCRIASIYSLASEEIGEHDVSDKSSADTNPLQKLGSVLVRSEEFENLDVTSRAIIRTAHEKGLVQKNNKVSRAQIWLSELVNTFEKWFRGIPFDVRKPYIDALVKAKDCLITAQQWVIKSDGVEAANKILSQRNRVIDEGQKKYPSLNAEKFEESVLSILEEKGLTNDFPNPEYASLLENPDFMKMLAKKEACLAMVMRTYKTISDIHKYAEKSLGMS